MSAPPSSLVPVAYGQGNHTHSLKHLKFHGILILVQPNNLEMFAGAALVETKIQVNCWAAETFNIVELEQSVKNIFFTIPQPRYTNWPSVAKSRCTDRPSVGIDVCQHHISVAVSGVGITYTDWQSYTNWWSDALLRYTNWHISQPMICYNFFTDWQQVAKFLYQLTIQC